MNTFSLEELPPLAPMEFFRLSLEVHKGKKISKSFLLPSTSSLFPEKPFADIGMAWSKEGLHFAAYVEKPFEECFFPDYQRGDALELFLDTRDVKTAGFATRFCHHFLFLPQKIGEMGSCEITRFRSEDKHPLCDPEEIQVTPHFEATTYRLEIFIPASCLHGYEPETFPRLGFTYRLNRYGGAPQHFSVASPHYAIEQQPSLWATVKLVT